MEKLEETILQLKKELTSLFTDLKNNRDKLSSLNSERSTLLMQFGNDIENYPIDFNIKLDKIDNEISSIKKTIHKNEIKIYGYRRHGKEGLFWKYERLTDKFKKQTIKSNKRFQEIQEEYTEEKNEKLKTKIIKYFEERGKNVSEDEIIDILLEVIGGVIDRHQEAWFNDNDKIEEEEIARVFKEKYSTTEIEIPILSEIESIEKGTNSIEIEIGTSLKIIIPKAQELIAENSKGVKAFLQEELEELIQKYKDEDNSTYLSMIKKDFVRHYIWGYVEQLARYKNFNTFWNSVFQKQ